MAQGSSIEWTDATWNPTAGCSLVSPGCTNCYAMKMAGRLEAMGQKKYVGLTKKVNGKTVWTGQMNMDDDALQAPLSWKKPRKVFVNSMSDLFHEGVPFDFIDKVFAVMALCPHHIFQVLTKRPERAAEYLSTGDSRRSDVCDAMNRVEEQRRGPMERAMHDYGEPSPWPLPNVWLGTSVENELAAHRIYSLRSVPAAVKFLSCEPLLGPLAPIKLDGIGWVIVGGESGPGARPMHPDWARLIRDQCAAAGVPFFFKQWGGWIEVDGPRCESIHADRKSGDIYLRIDGTTATGSARSAYVQSVMRPVGKKAAGRLLDGREHNEFPAPRPEAVKS